MDDGREKTAVGGIEIARAEVLLTEWSGNELAKFLGFGEATVLQSMRKTEVSAFGVDGEATLTAILEDKRTQIDTGLGIIGRQRNLQLKDRF